MSFGKTVYVLGAGVSKDAGCPLVSQFTRESVINELKAKLQNQPEDFSRLNQVAHYIRDRIEDGYCADNIESVLNHAATAKYLDTRSLTEYKYGRYLAKDIFTDLQWFIVKVLEKKTKTIIPSYYFRFFKDICKKDTIITFNYDLVIEKVLEQLGEQFGYGIEENPVKDRLILKLHGSVNWAFCDSCGRLTYGPSVASQSYVALDIYKGKATCRGCGSGNIKSVLVPPLLYKDAFYQDTKGGNWIKDLWMKAHDELAEARNVIFIGFAMSDNDAYAQELFKISSNANTTRGLNYLVVNPSRNKSYRDLKKRYKRVLVNEKVQFKRVTFREYIDSWQ